MRWSPSPSQLRSWTEGGAQAYEPGGPTVSLKICLPASGDVSLDILRESWIPAGISPDSLRPQPTAVLGSRSTWRGIPYQEVLLRPLRPSGEPGRSELLTEVELKVSAGGSARMEDPRLIPGAGPFAGLFANPQDVAKLGGLSSGKISRNLSDESHRRWEGLLGTRHRVAVSRDGVYRLERDYLLAQGFDAQGLDPRKFRLRCRGIEIPILVEGEADGSFDSGDAIVFYGQKLEVRDRDAWNGGDWTDTNTYWLQAETTPGLRMASEGAIPVSADEVTHLPHTVRFEENIYLDSVSHFRPNRDLWFWSPFYGGSPGAATDRLLEIPGPSASACEVTVQVAGWSSGGHSVSLRLNGAAPTAGADPSSWTGSAAHVQTWEFGTGLLPGPNTFTFISPGGDYQIPDFVDVTYDRALVASGGALEFTTAGSPGVLVAAGFAQEPYAFDVTQEDPSQGIVLPVRLTGMEYDPVPQLVRFEGTAAPPRRYALSSAPLLPDSVQLCTSRDLSSPAFSADLLIITHPDFHPAGQDSEWQDYLARRRATMDVEVVDIQEVYDNFSYGIFDPTAIKTFLQVVQGSWSKFPSQMLLVGDGTYDYKDYGHKVDTEPTYKNWVPTMMIEDLADSTYLGRYPSDAWFGDLDGDGYPDLSVGRLPARTYRGFADMLTKIMGYEDQALTGSWHKTHFYVGDTWDEPWEQDAFEGYNEALRTAYSQPPWAWERVFYHGAPYNGTNSVACAADIRARFPLNALTHFSGHSGFNFWSSHQIFSSSRIRNGNSASDVDLLAETTHLPFVVGSTCYTSAFCEPHLTPLNEDLTARGRRGAIGTAGPSTIAYIDEEETFASAFFQLAFGRFKVRTVGDLVEAGRFALPSANPRAQFNYVLLGDPSLRLLLPAPAPPPSLAAQAGNASVDLSWSSAPGVAGYHVERSENDGATWTRVTASSLPSSQTTYRDSGLVNTREYLYAVVSVDAEAFDGAPSEAVSATPTNPDPPAVPAGLNVADPGLETALDLSWLPNSESDLAGYILARGTVPGSYAHFTEFPQGTTTVRITGLVGGTRYYFALRARNTSGRESPYCEERSGVPSGLRLAVRPPAAIADLKVTREEKNIGLAWSRPVADVGGQPVSVAGYTVYRVQGTWDWSLDGVGSYSEYDLVAQIPDPGVTSYLDEGAFTLPSPLSYLVVAWSEDGFASPASVAPPAPVLDLRASRSPSGGRTLLTFSPVTGTVAGTACSVAHYEVYGFYPVAASSDHVAPESSRVALSATLLSTLPPCEAGAVFCENPAEAPPLFYTVVAVDRRGNRALY